MTAPGEIVLAACWAHARRKFYDLHEATGSPIAAEALRRIAELYAIERSIQGRTADARRHTITSCLDRFRETGLTSGRHTTPEFKFSVYTGSLRMIGRIDDGLLFPAIVRRPRNITTGVFGTSNSMASHGIMRRDRFVKRRSRL
jgi:Transposase IS66 family